MAQSTTPNRSQTHYAPRNVLNASEIKQAILSRSIQRNDPENINAWLKNHFFRYVIGNFVLDNAHSDSTELRQIHSLEQAQQIWLNSQNGPSANEEPPLPEWLERAIKSGDTLFWIDPIGVHLLELEAKLVEFLHARKGTSLEHKLMRVNAFQAIALYEFEHQLFASRQQNGLEAHHPDATRSCLKTVQGEFVEILPESPNFRKELVYESQRMRHCIGQFADKKSLTGGYAEHYASECENKKLRIFSFRTENHHPRITISARISDRDTLIIEEVKGKQNQPPVEKYHANLIEFLNSLPCEVAYPNDLCRIGLVFADNCWKPLSTVDNPNEQSRIAWQAPALAKQLPNLPRIGQWMLAARSVEQLSEINAEHYICELISVN